MKKLWFVFILFCNSLHVSAEVKKEFQDYIDMAANQNLNMNSRWTSLIRSVEYANKEHLAEVIKFTQNKEWYMRNAALIALVKADKNLAIIEAKKLIKDKALVVRSAAVEILFQNFNEEHKKILIDEMDQGYNFNKKKSLWIRRQIIEKLSLNSETGDKSFYVKYLFDDDKSVAQISAKSLERITGTQLPSKKFVESWRSHVKEKNWN